MRAALYSEPIERAPYLPHDLGQCRLGRERVARQRRGPAAREHPLGTAGKTSAMARLQIAAMNPHETRSVRGGAGKQIPLVALARAIGEIEVPWPFLAEAFGCCD